MSEQCCGVSVTLYLAARQQDGADPVIVFALFEVHEHAGVQDAPELDPVLEASPHLRDVLR